MFLTSQRKLRRAPPNRGAAQWIVVARWVLLTLLTLATLAFGAKRLVPDIAPSPELVLFWGGLLGLLATFVLPPLASGGMWIGTVAVAVSVALVEGWRTWRLDPDRGTPA